jgi:light-regulated signal transduction histidine kinase (bacteriophytochrome)
MGGRNHTDNDWLAKFLDRLVHDMREPLRSISAYADLLRETEEGRTGEEADRALNEIPAGASKIGKLLEGLSSYATALRESAETGPPASMQSAFTIVMSELGEQIRASGATVTAAGLPEVNVGLEALMQLLRNLIGNALRFRSDAAPVVRLTAAMEEPDMWTIRVEDNGIGIATEDRDAVFEPFMRVAGRKYGGVGLGLTVCKTIVEAHGGTIRMEAAPGGGALCVFTLPEA